MSTIYRILSRGDWELARTAGEFRGSDLDRRDGFIHLSAAEQLAGTLRAHFAGQRDLVLLYVRLDALPESALRWEPSRAGALFPHLYAPLSAAAVYRVEPLELSENGVHRLPSVESDA